MKAFILLAVLTISAQAQQPDCNLARRMWDSPISYGSTGAWQMPRYGWHALNAARAVVATEAIHRAFGVSRRKAAFIPPLASIATHLIGYATHQYGFTWRDWIFDAGVSALAIVLASDHKPIAATLYVAQYAVNACYASP